MAILDALIGPITKLIDKHDELSSKRPKPEKEK